MASLSTSTSTSTSTSPSPTERSVSGDYSLTNYNTEEFISRRRSKRAFHSRRLIPEDLNRHTPWFESKQGKSTLRRSYWTIVACSILGIAIAAGIFVLTYFSVPKHEYCLVLDEQFNGNSIDTSVWTHEIQVGASGSNGFAMTTNSANNSYVRDGRLYIVPTLTSDNLGIDAITDGYVFNLTQSGTCTALNSTNCIAFSNHTSSNLSVIPPIQSAQLTTRLSKSIRYGRIEVKAVMPNGDWIYPAIRLLPRDNIYGSYPSSGQIDVVESRGNAVTNQNQQYANSVSSTLHWGPQPINPTGISPDGSTKTSGFKRLIRKYWSTQDFVYGLEWDSQSIYTWYTSRAREIFRHDFSSSFWNLGGYNAGFTDPWDTKNHTNATPFDQNFYVSISLGVGGTTGYFEDSPNKPWSNNAFNAAGDFWASREKWLSSWSTNPEKRALSIEYIKIWSIKEPGQSCPL